MTVLEVEKEINFDEIFSVEKRDNHYILTFNENFKNLIVFDPGLYHTAICKSELCKIDKKTGKLFYRKENVEEKKSNDFLDVAYFILFGNSNRKEEFKNYVFEFFKLLPEQKKLLDAIASDCHPMEVLSMAIIGLNCLEKKYLKDSNDLVEKVAFIIAQVATVVAYRYVRYHNNLWIDDRLEMPYAQQILFRMHSGKNIERLIKLGKILNTIMVLHAEHGQNCSAATVRNIASARGSIYTAVASGMSAFNGKIHGGASQEVSQMYDEILKNNIDVESYVRNKVNNKELLTRIFHEN